MAYKDLTKKKLNDIKKYYRKMQTPACIARRLLRQAVVAGKIIKPKTCSVCLCDGRIEAHHNNYDKPYEVIWLCSNCHRNLHSTLFVISGSKRKNPVRKQNALLIAKQKDIDWCSKHQRVHKYHAWDSCRFPNKRKEMNALLTTRGKE